MYRTSIRMGGVGLIVALSIQTAQAAPPADDPKDQPPSKVVAELIARGKREYSAGHQAQAYDAFRAAWAVYKSPKLACLLGQVELELEKHRDAAEHLTTCGAHFPLPQRGRDDLARAKSHLVTLELAAPVGARVYVDALAIGKAPLSFPIFLEPGKHELTVQLNGYVAHTEVLQTSAGDSLKKRIELEPLASEPTQADVTVSSEPAKAAPTEPSSGPTAKTLTLIGGGVVTLGFVAAGVVYRLNAASREDDRQRLRAQLDSNSACYNSTSDLCLELSQAQQDYIDYAHTSNLMFGIGAGFAALTIGAYFLWPDANRDEARRPGAWMSVGVGPRGVMAHGVF